MTTDMHKAPSVARKALTSTDDATPVARYDLSTSEGGRRYIADFFATELRRHDFARYINTHLAADFACALAQHLAATGKQQAGEVQGAVPAQFEAWAVSIGAPTDKDEHGNYLSSALNYSKLGWDAALAARQPGAQADEAAILRHGAAVLDMWEGDPNVTGYMGDFKDACAILEVLALHAAPPAQGVDLGQQQDAARWRWVREQNGVTVSVEEADDDGDMTFVSGHTPEELDAAIDGQRDAASRVGDG